jgi:hypothetical protein
VDEIEKWLPACIEPHEINFVRSGTDVEHIATAKITLVTYGLLQQPAMREQLEGQRFQCVIVDESYGALPSLAANTP